MEEITNLKGLTTSPRQPSAIIPTILSWESLTFLVAVPL